MNSLPVFAGFCYTQFCDTYQEATGLLRADRAPKIPIDQIRAATNPELTHAPAPIWRERLMSSYVNPRTESMGS